MRYTLRAVLAVFNGEKKLSITALSQTFPERLIEQVMPQSIFRRFPLDPLRKLPSGDDPSLFADTVAPLLSVSVEEKQRLLETSDVVTRRKRLIELMNPGRANAVA